MDTTSWPAPARHAGAVGRRMETAPVRNAAPTRRLADDFFLMIYDEGRPRLTGRILNLGLAGALLGELALLDAFDIHNGVLRAGVPLAEADPLIAGIYDHLRFNERRPVRDWLDFIALTAVEKVGGRLLAEGLIARTPPMLRLRGRNARWWPTDSGKASWPAVHLRMQVEAGTADPSPLMLLALTGITGLNHPSLHSVADLLRDPAATARTLAPLAAFRPALPQLLEHTHTAVDSAVVSRHG